MAFDLAEGLKLRLGGELLHTFELACEHGETSKDGRLEHKHVPLDRLEHVVTLEDGTRNQVAKDLFKLLIRSLLQVLL